jgi:LuxR family maltose regulon positive regulatory protein
LKKSYQEPFLSSPILKTKLHIPAIHKNIITRQRLFQRLDAGVDGKLTLISASAGFGKSTLLSAWMQQAKARTRIAWLSLDEGDNDLTQFLAYFVAALQTIESNIGQGVLVALHSPGVVNSEVILTTLINEIAEFLEDVVLILDDYHVIESLLIDQALTYLLDHLPTQMHLVISSRIDPSWPLSRLRARGQMTEIRAIDLRFTTDEAATFLNQVMGFDLSTQDVAALEARTEGWIAGLQLAAHAMQGMLSMQGGDDIQGFVRSFTGSNRYILDYLGDEVLSLQPPNIQDFLMQTSILKRLTGSLCDAVCGAGGRVGDETLESLDRENVFIIPLDNERHWYRYHHLFADMLERRLHQTQPELMPQLHARASEWYKSHGFQFEAVHHALAGRHLDRAADLIEDYGLSMIGQGAFTTVQRWINSLPKSIVRKQPYLCVYHAWASNFTHQLEIIEPYLQDAQCALQDLEQPADDAMTRDLLGHIATLRAWNARRQRNNSLAIDILKDAVDCLGDINPFVCTFAKLNLGLAYMDSGELVKAASSLREAVSQGHASENELAALIATSHLAAILILQGRLHEAAKLCRQTIQDQLLLHEKPTPTLCMIYLRLGWVLAEWNDIDGFYANLSQGVILADQIGYDSVVTAGSRAMAWEKQLLAEQDVVIEFSEDVAKIIERVLAIEADGSGTSPSSIETQNIEIYLGDDAYFEIFPGYSNHARAKNLADQGKVDDALALLEQIYEAAQAVEGIGLMIEARSMEALICQSQDDMDRALDALGDALSLGEAEGYMRTFLDRDEPMAQLLTAAAERGIMPGYTSKLLAAFDANNHDNTTPTPQPLIEPLSKREIEVLQLVAQGLSNREISERLFLALDTVKGHNHKIYGKLGVRRRIEAIERARELGLL